MEPPSLEDPISFVFMQFFGGGGGGGAIGVGASHLANPRSATDRLLSRFLETSRNKFLSLTLMFHKKFSYNQLLFLMSVSVSVN